jgi:hypothetical protein
MAEIRVDSQVRGSCASLWIFIVLTIARGQQGHRLNALFLLGPTDNPMPGLAPRFRSRRLDRQRWKPSGRISRVKMFLKPGLVVDNRSDLNLFPLRPGTRRASMALQVSIDALPRRSKNLVVTWQYSKF